MKLSGPQVKQIQDALLDAFGTRDSLRMMVRTGLDQRLEAIADGENMQVVIFNLVSWAEQYGRIRDLIDAAQNQNPGNESLQNLVKDLESSLRPSTTFGRPNYRCSYAASSPAGIRRRLSQLQPARYKCHAGRTRDPAGDWTCSLDGRGPGARYAQLAIHH